MLVLAIVLVVAGGAVAAVLMSTDGTGPRPAADARSAPAAASSSAPAPAAVAEPALWPFRTLDEARRWQQEQQPGGHSPWHLDAEATALSFTTGYLGFAEVDTVLRSEVDATEALVEVGYAGESGRPSPAATLRLVRFGDGPHAPWEVAGTVDGTLTITEPAPDAVVTSPVRVGGLVSGVDESIRVQLRDPSAPKPIGESCCRPAGGENSPWSVTVGFTGASGATLTVVASSGGHVTDVEGFAVIGTRPAI
ncbi:MAG: hypothetical protein GEV28_17130 [Actinophytocola sp.]|nr:hypothetical protein [Actinophytocola sp.]